MAGLRGTSAAGRRLWSTFLCENKGPPPHNLKEATQSVSCPGFLLRQFRLQVKAGWGWGSYSGGWTEYARRGASL